MRYLFYLDRKLIQEGHSPIISPDALRNGGLLQAYATYGNQELECEPLYVRKSKEPSAPAQDQATRTKADETARIFRAQTLRGTETA